MKEADIMRDIQLEASKLGHRLFRNNIGAFEDTKGNIVKFGLGVGTSDLIGFTNKGRFLAVEVKIEGKDPTPSQINFICAVNHVGGLAFVAHSKQEFIENLTSAL